MFHICTFLIYKTPLVLGTSFPPVLWIASRMASANALNADSALTTYLQFRYIITKKVKSPRTDGDRFLHAKHQHVM
jgi:hypothetical protein